MPFELPPKDKVGYLDPEIAGEGERVITSEGDVVNWTPPPVRPAVPDMSQVKSLRKYFGRTGHGQWPAWLYHPVEKPRIVKNAQEAAALGVCYRKATDDERMRYGLQAMWDWKEDTEWRPKPFPKDLAFDPDRLETGKTLVHREKSNVVAQNEMIEKLVPQIAAAVAAAVAAAMGVKPSAPVLNAAANAMAAAPEPRSIGDAVSVDEQKTESDKALKAMWIAEAETRGVKVDKRWGVERIKAEVEKAA
jgi:hypothetical protein